MKEPAILTSTSPPWLKASAMKDSRQRSVPTESRCHSVSDRLIRGPPLKLRGAMRLESRCAPPPSQLTVPEMRARYRGSCHRRALADQAATGANAAQVVSSAEQRDARASGGTADAPALGAGVARRASSNLASPTIDRS